MAENKVISVDLGGTNLRVGLVKGRKIMRYVKKPTPKNKKDILNLITNLIQDLMDKDVKGIGVGSPGPLKNGVIKNTPNLPLKNFDLKKFLEKKFKKKVVVENDANCVALAEAKYGCKKKNFFILTFGTGIGGGIIIDGKIYSGRGQAGELGHIILNNGEDFEALWKKKGKKISELFDEENKNNLNKTLKYIGQGIASMINIFDPEVVIIFGGVKENGKKFVEMIKKHTKRHVILDNMPDIKWSNLDHPGILGASLLIK